MDKIDELFRQNPNLERLMRPDAHELEGLSDSIELLRCTRDDDPENPEVNFQLAAALISHSRKSFVEEGVRLMEALVCQRWQNKWSDVVGRNAYLPPTDVPAIAKGIAVSRATAPPPSDDDEDSLPEVSADSEMGEDEEAAGPSPPTAQPPVTGGHEGDPQDSSEASYDVLVSEDPTVVNRTVAAAKDEDASKIRPGRIDELALYHYYLTLGWIKLKEMGKAESCVDQMLILAPGNKQGRALKMYIEVAGRQGTAVDAATLAGISVVIAGVATLAGAFLRGKQNAS